jgi:hypothetical protein
MRVLFGDGSPPKPVTSNVEISHMYYRGGLYTITLLGPFQEHYLEQVDMSGDHVIVSESWPVIYQFSVLTRVIDVWVVGYGEVGTFKIGR